VREITSWEIIVAAHGKRNSPTIARAIGAREGKADQHHTGITPVGFAR
jgi:hypothetical protein